MDGDWNVRLAEAFRAKAPEMPSKWQRVFYEIADALEKQADCEELLERIENEHSGSN